MMALSTQQLSVTADNSRPWTALSTLAQ